MRELEIDLGNTFAKWRVCLDGQYCATEKGELEDLESLLNDLSLDRVLISSVAAKEKNEKLTNCLVGQGVSDVYWAKSGLVMMGVRSGYSDYEKLGVDRWLACLAAYSAAQDACCVIDFGSAITVDLVSSDGVHQGGYIAPGAGLCFKSLADNTGNLQGSYGYVSNVGPGVSTKDCIENGVYLMQLGFLKEVLASFKGKRFFCTGGGYRQFAEAMKLGAVEYTEDLVLNGLRLSYENTTMSGGS